MGIFGKIFDRGGEDQAAPECEPLAIYTPTEGEVIPLEEFPDETFCEGIMGPGCGILPSGDMVAAPFNGTVTQVVDTSHAVGLTSDDGVEVLIHVGVDTVSMNGKGFQCLVKKNQKIGRGDSLIRFDRSAIREAGYSDAIAVVVTNGDEYEGLDVEQSGETEVGDVLLRVRK